jgi:hypothetical protein
MEQAEILVKLAETGILGILLALSLIAIGILYKDNRKLQSDRIQDLKDARDVVKEPLQAIKQTVDLIFQSVNRRQD